MSLNDNNRETKSPEQTKGSILLALGELVTRKRLEKGLSVHELATIAGIEPSVIDAIEAGSWDVSPELSAQIVQVLSLKLTDQYF